MKDYPCDICKRLTKETGWYEFYAEGGHREQGRKFRVAVREKLPINLIWTRLALEAHADDPQAIRDFSKGMMEKKTDSFFRKLLKRFRKKGD